MDTSIFWDSPIGEIVRVVLVFVGILVIIFAGFKVIKDILGGKIAKAVVTVFGAAVLAAFLLNPPLFTNLIDAVGNLVETVLNTADDVSGGGGGGGTGGGDGGGIVK